MTVNDLLNALKGVPGYYDVRLIPPDNNDEYHATYVAQMKSPKAVLICANHDEKTSTEIVLHDDNPEE